MKAQRTILRVGCVLFLFHPMIPGANAAAEADLLLANGTNYTANERLPQVEAVAVKNTRLVTRAINRFEPFRNFTKKV